MPNYDNTPLLDKSSLFEILTQRFDKEEKKLSQIPSPTLLQNAPKAAKK
ncbi:hypothetical protein [Candidatus Sulfurimonas marisnigri]|nr:hypothetical protein [Candidatus Sulfurimonas marisnigri]